MGSHGELWSRMRGRGSGGSDKSYFYCELTGTFAKEIFDYHSDVDQKGSSTLSYGLFRLPASRRLLHFCFCYFDIIIDASKLGGDSFPSCAIIGQEMGLGKTVIALSLIVASPPALENRMLPREHEAKIDHPAYLPPPSVDKMTSSNCKSSFMSNATLVIAQ